MRANANASFECVFYTTTRAANLTHEESVIRVKKKKRCEQKQKQKQKLKRKKTNKKGGKVALAAPTQRIRLSLRDHSL